MKNYAIIAFIALCGYSFDIYAKTESEYKSPVDFTEKYIKDEVSGYETENTPVITIASVLSGAESETPEQGRELSNNYCLNDKFSKENYLNSIGKNCESQNGVWLNNKLCVSKKDNKLYYFVEVDSASIRRIISENGKPACKSSKYMDVFIKEYTAPRSTEKSHIAKCPKLEYPRTSLRLNEQGTVPIKLKVSSNGTLSEKALESSSGFPSLDDGALKFVTRCIFIPKIINGVASEDEMSHKITYQLYDRTEK